MDDSRVPLDQLRPGFRPPPFIREVGLHHWNRFAAVNDEFVSIHMDEAAGRRAGYPGAFGMGNLHLSHLHVFLRDWLGPAGWVTRLQVRFEAPSLPGVNRSCGVVTAVEHRADAVRLDLDVWVEDEAGARLTTGEATVLVRSDAPRGDCA